MSNNLYTGFRFSISALHLAAQRLREALQDAVLGAPVAAHLPATFVADFDALVDQVAQHAIDQNNATGTAIVHTSRQNAAWAELIRLAGVARNCAVLAFPGEDALLRSEFQLGVHVPRDLARVLERSRRLLAACRARAAALAPRGWSAASSAALEAAIDALAGAGRDQEAAQDAKEGLTAQRVSAARELYRQCRALQHAARLVYTSSGSVPDASLVAGRTRFLLDEFPTRFGRSTAPAAPAAAPAPPPVA